MFQKKPDNSLSHFKIDKQDLGSLAQSSTFLKEIVNIVRMFSVHDLDSNDD